MVLDDTQFFVLYDATLRQEALQLATHVEYMETIYETGTDEQGLLGQWNK